MRVMVALEDVGELPELINMLESGDERVAHQAWIALRSMTGEDLDENASSWDAWYQRELNGWLKRASTLTDDLVGGTPEQAVRAILELGKCRHFRDEAAFVLARGMERNEPELMRLCCQILGTLGSPLARPALQSALLHSNASVRDAAAQAITLLDKPQG